MAFDSLDEMITHQTLNYGASIDDIKFSESLNVTVQYDILTEVQKSSESEEETTSLEASENSE